MAEAEALLTQHGLDFTCPALNQLKVGPVNYWPATGTCHIDEHSRSRPTRGLKALAAALSELGLLCTDPTIR
jgi:hypothetical protein